MLKRLLADLLLDRHILQEIVRKSCKASGLSRERDSCGLKAGRYTC
jgi:hypothetical protein